MVAAVIALMPIDLSMKSRRDDGVDRDRQQRWETHTRRISKRDIMLRFMWSARDRAGGDGDGGSRV